MSQVKLFGIAEGIICQQCNCRGAYGAGLSGAISKEFPQVLDAFKRWNRQYPGADMQLGKYQIVPLAYKGENIGLAVANIFTQRDYGNAAKTGIVYTKTDLLVACIGDIAEKYPNLPIYLPHSVDKDGKHSGIGCGLAGEKWENLYERIQKLNLPNLHLLNAFTVQAEPVQNEHLLSEVER